MTTTRRMRRPRALLAAALLTAGAMTLAACTSGGGGGAPSPNADKPVRGQTFTVQMAGDPGSLDPNASGTISTDKLSEILFERLFATDAQYKPRPMLVDTYTVSDDGLHYTFHLRKDIDFSDGTPMTSADVVASLQYWMRLNATGKQVKADLASLTAPDEDTVKLDLKKRFYPLLSLLAGDETPILKASVAKGVDTKGFTEAQAIGTGPYMLKSWKPNQEIVLVRNPHYTSRHDKPSGYAGAKHAYFKKLDFRIVGDPDAIVNGLKTGQWDYAWPSTDQYQAMKSNPDLVTRPLTGGNLNVVFLNHHASSIFSKPEVRDAVNLAIDKKAINAATGGGDDLTTMSGAFETKANKALYSTEGEKAYKAYDPKKAKRMLADAGVKPGTTVRILTTGEFPQFKQWATIIQQNLKKVGLETKIKVYDQTTMFSIVFTKPKAWDMLPLIAPGDKLTPQDSPMLNFDALGWDSPALAKDLTAYNEASGPGQAKKAVDALQALVWKDKPGIALSMTKPYASYTPRLRGYQDYWYAFWNAWLAPKK